VTVLVTPDGLRRAAPPASGSFPFPAPSPARALPSAGYVPLLSREELGATYEAMWRRQPWVYVCVNKLTRGQARLPLKAFRYLDEEGARGRARGHPLAELLARPFPRASGWTLKAAWSWSLAVHGNALVVKVRPARGAPPAELWPIPWRRVETVGDPSGFVDHFVFHGPGDRWRILPEDAVHFSETPGLVGVSPMEPLRVTLGLEDAAQRWAAGHFAKGASPGGLFRTARKLDDKSVPRLRAELDKLYAGVDQAGNYAIVDQDLDFKEVMQSAVDTALIEQRKLSREEVAAAYDIPPPVIGILDRATFSNVTELHKALYVDTLGPRLTLAEETLMAQLVGPEPTWDGVFIEHDLGEVLKGDLEARARAHLMFQQSSTLTVNERRALENRPPIPHPDADTVLMPVNMVPIGASPADVETRARAAVALGPAPAPPVPAPNGDAGGVR
jgi:phage portal protein, HK97 family